MFTQVKYKKWVAVKFARVYKIAQIIFKTFAQSHFFTRRQNYTKIKLDKISIALRVTFAEANNFSRVEFNFYIIFFLVQIFIFDLTFFTITVVTNPYPRSLTYFLFISIAFNYSLIPGQVSVVYDSLTERFFVHQVLESNIFNVFLLFNKYIYLLFLNIILISNFFIFNYRSYP